MFKNILVPTDLSEKTVKSLEIAMRMVQGEDCQITLLHVIETIDGADEKEFKEFYQKLKDRAQLKMDGIVAPYDTDKLGLHLEIVFGKRVKEIVRFAYENEVDLIILSSHRINKIDAGEGWATISYKVGILSHCPVMMVK